MHQEWSTDPSVAYSTATLVGVFAIIYSTQQHHFQTAKQKSYILSTIAAGIMSLLSLWFVYTWVKGSGDGRRFDFGRVVTEHADSAARYGTVFFRSYLFGMSLSSARAKCSVY